MFVLICQPVYFFCYLFFDLSTMAPSVRRCFIRFRPSYCSWVRHSILLMKFLVQWSSVCVDPLLHMYIVYMSLILFVFLPSIKLAHPTLYYSSTMYLILILSGSPSRSWNLLLFHFPRYVISQMFRSVCVRAFHQLFYQGDLVHKYRRSRFILAMIQVFYRFI